MRTSNEIGDWLEGLVKRVLGGEKVKQSGGGKFWKGDNTTRAGFRFVWQCKATDKDYLRITADMIEENRQAVRGMRRSGDDFRAGMVLGLKGKAYALVELDDMAELLTADPSEITLLPPSKAAERRAGTRRHRL